MNTSTVSVNKRARPTLENCGLPEAFVEENRVFKLVGDGAFMPPTVAVYVFYYGTPELEPDGCMFQTKIMIPARSYPHEWAALAQAKLKNARNQIRDIIKEHEVKCNSRFPWSDDIQ